MPICNLCKKDRCEDLIMGSETVGWICVPCLIMRIQKQIDELKKTIKRILKHNF